MIVRIPVRVRFSNSGGIRDLLKSHDRRLEPGKPDLFSVLMQRGLRQKGVSCDNEQEHHTI